MDGALATNVTGEKGQPLGLCSDGIPWRAKAEQL